MSTVATSRPKATKDVVLSVIVAVVATGLSYALGVGFGWIDSVNWLEAAAVFTSYSCTFLCVKERRINYPIGALSTLLYFILFFQSGLVASGVVNVYLTALLVYGWFRWRADAVTRPVTHVEWKMVPVYLLATAAFFGGALALTVALGAPVVPTDAAVLGLTILAQFLLDNKKLENWGVWALVNVFAIYTYFHAGLFIVGVQYVFFLANTVYGWYAWNKSKKTTAMVAQPAAQPAEVV